MIHLDAAHDYHSVFSDLSAWWPLLRDGGTLIGDDYAVRYAGVTRAFDEYFGALGLPITSSAGKCKIQKG
jgi:hypothetical protein